ncbi:hypothetical protein GIB67_040885 [Kingdonia uniflora]|uniref:Uncharacterized protein n=1 Tax=Kingdonia uniflora TaxID=39325 RepID=A0A7J7L842_9MAGN|nr:hypothetical protein GIB67_040885 [Kingdonia uniflora]
MELSVGFIWRDVHSKPHLLQRMEYEQEVHAVRTYQLVQKSCRRMMLMGDEFGSEENW